MKFDPSSIEHLNIYLPGHLEIKIDNQHDWQRVERGIDNLTKAIRRGYEDAAEKIGLKLIRVIKKAIDLGRPPGGGSWAPLSENTLNQYRRKGFEYGTSPWKRTGKFYEAIDYYQDDRGRMYVGVGQQSPYTDNYERGEDIRAGLSIIELAKMLEFGGGRMGKIPPRPLFNPALNGIGGKAAIKKEMLTSLREQAKAIGFKYVRIR